MVGRNAPGMIAKKQQVEQDNTLTSDCAECSYSRQSHASFASSEFDLLQAFGMSLCQGKRTSRQKANYDLQNENPLEGDVRSARLRGLSGTTRVCLGVVSLAEQIAEQRLGECHATVRARSLRADTSCGHRFHST